MDTFNFMGVDLPVELPPFNGVVSRYKEEPEDRIVDDDVELLTYADAVKRQSDVFEEHGIYRNNYFHIKTALVKERRKLVLPLRQTWILSRKQDWNNRFKTDEWRAYQEAKKPFVKALKGNRARWKLYNAEYKAEMEEISVDLVELWEKEEAARKFAEAEKKRIAEEKAWAKAQAEKERQAELESQRLYRDVIKKGCEYRIKELEPRIRNLLNKDLSYQENEELYLLEYEYNRMRSILKYSDKPTDKELEKLKEWAGNPVTSDYDMILKQEAEKKAKRVADRREIQKQKERDHIARIQSMTEEEFREYFIEQEEANPSFQRLNLSPLRKQTYFDDEVEAWKKSIDRWKKAGKPLGEW